MILSQNVVDNLNFKLDDLGIPGTSRFCIEDFNTTKFNDNIISTCAKIIHLLSLFDSNIPDTIIDSVGKVTTVLQLRNQMCNIKSPYEVLNYLCIHLQAERLHAMRQKSINKANASHSQQPPTNLNDSIMYYLQKIAKYSKLSTAPANNSPDLEGLQTHIETLMNTDTTFESPILLLPFSDAQSSLSPKQKELVTNINHAFQQDFIIRRQMLLKRFDVTIQSFLWSSRSEGKEEDIVQSIRKEQQHLTSQIVKYELDDVFKCPASLLHEQSRKVTGLQLYTSGDHGENGISKSSHSLKSVLIGGVPDRGGRPGGEMRSKANVSGRGRGGRGGAGGRDRGRDGGRKVDK